MDNKNNKKKKRQAGDINFVFCSDEFILNFNKSYLEHDTYTDIITFDNSDKNQAKTISGDIIISIERVRENGLKYSETMEQELQRVIIHGILHLLGYKDKKESDKKEMRKEEDLCLKELKKMLSD